jgi:hypothetical protein
MNQNEGALLNGVHSLDIFQYSLPKLSGVYYRQIEKSKHALHRSQSWAMPIRFRPVEKGSSPWR